MGKRSKQRREQKNEGKPEASEPPLQKEEHVNPQDLTIQQLCDLIADISEAILESPTEAFSTTAGPSKMNQLLVLARNPDEYVARLAVVSLLAIFKDILPSYRIRLPTEKELLVKVSKEVRQTREYERNLLNFYQQYLQLLEKKWDKAKGGIPSPLQITCMLSLCELLSTAYTFNFRSNLLTVVVRNMNTGVSTVVSEACCKAVEKVFREDAQGQIAEEAANKVAKVITKASVLRPAVVKTFKSIPLKVHEDEAAAAKLLQQSKKKQKRKDKDTAAIEAEMKESEATVDKAVLARCQAQTLHTVTLSYFRIIKQCQGGAAKSTRDEILSAALDGLAKIAHLINMETVMDLLGVLKNLLSEVDTLALDAALNCILTAFQTLQGPGKELKIDIKEYLIPLYTQLPRLCFACETSSSGGTSSSSPTDLMLRCLDVALMRRREFSATRVAAFFKQIVTVALHTPPATAVPLMAFARNLLQRYQSIQPLLENDDDVVITSGEYDPNAADPENSNPFSTPAWELALLAFHFRSDIRHQAKAAAALKMLQLPAEGANRLRVEKRKEQEEAYISFQRMKKKHPLEQSKSKGGKGNVRFVTPRAKRLRVIPPE